MVSFQFLADWLIKLSDASCTNQTRKTKNPAESRIFFISEVQNRCGIFLSRILFSFWNFEQYACANRLKMLLYNICLKIVLFSRQKTWKKYGRLKYACANDKKKLLVVFLSFITCNISSIKVINFLIICLMSQIKQVDIHIKYLN